MMATALGGVIGAASEPRRHERRIRLRPEHPSGLALQLATMSQAAPNAPKSGTSAQSGTSLP
jgi:hypothetical protein